MDKKLKVEKSSTGFSPFYMIWGVAIFSDLYSPCPCVSDTIDSTRALVRGVSDEHPEITVVGGLAV